MGCNWEVKGRIGTGTVDGVHGPGEKARGSTVAPFAIRDTGRIGGRATDIAAAHGVFLLTKPGTVSPRGEVPVPNLFEPTEEQLAPLCRRLRFHSRVMPEPFARDSFRGRVVRKLDAIRAVSTDVRVQSAPSHPGRYTPCD